MFKKIEGCLHTYTAGIGGFVLSVLSTISAPQFIAAATPLLGNHVWAQTVVHSCTLVGVTLALNGRGFFSKGPQ